MPDIVLAAFNSKYAHTSFALRYLKANLGDLKSQCELLEMTLEDRPVDVLEKILAHQPRIVGLSVYIWNALLSLELAQALKRVAPEVVLVIGGPEVSYESEQQPICALADYVVQQEGDEVFAQLCAQILSGQRPQAKIHRGPLVDLSRLKSPYSLYSDQDVAHRVLYVEASRGCPFRCEFCLSSLDQSVRNFPIEPLLEELQGLYGRGARQFKFIDRTFNLKVETSTKILSFFLDKVQGDNPCFVHFEMIPDRFPPELKELVCQFPEGSLQFEIGIQSFDAQVGQRISRRQDIAKLEENLLFLRRETGVYIHADLIVGLPGEDIETFGRGFDRLVQLGPQEIQVGILKRLRGTPICRHDQEWQMIYAPNPPYEILCTRSVPFDQMQQMKRFARFWDLIANRSQFPRTLPLLLARQPFVNFLGFSNWLFKQSQSTHKFSLVRLAELLCQYLENQRQLDSVEVMTAIALDYMADGKRYIPPFLLERSDLPSLIVQRPKPLRSNVSESKERPTRQARHYEHLRN